MLRLKETFCDSALSLAHMTDSFTYADIVFAPRVIILDHLGVAVPRHLNNLRSWVDRLKQRPSLGTLEN